mgnify:FL=1
MEKYKINISYGNEDLNVLMIKVLIDEIKKMICKKDDFGVISNCTYFTSLEKGGKY